jgi:hypothetical protein
MLTHPVGFLSNAAALASDITSALVDQGNAGGVSVNLGAPSADRRLLFAFYIDDIEAQQPPALTSVNVGGVSLSRVNFYEWTSDGSYTWCNWEWWMGLVPNGSSGVLNYYTPQTSWGSFSWALFAATGPVVRADPLVSSGPSLTANMAAGEHMLAITMAGNWASGADWKNYGYGGYTAHSPENPHAMQTGNAYAVNTGVLLKKT